MPLGLGIGIHKILSPNIAVGLTSTFKQRVTSNGGVFEAYDCSILNIQRLMNINLA